MILPLTVDSINGLRSQISAGSRARSGDDDYYRVVELIRRMQLLVRITSSTEEPEDAFVAVRYRDHWYSIDDRDFKSKSVFTFVMILFSLRESGDNANLPVITIPTG